MGTVTDLELWLRAARAVLPTCQNPELFRARIAEQEQKQRQKQGRLP